MRPVLFHIGGIPIYSYSFFVVMAYLACLTYAWLEARRQKLEPVHAVDLSMVIFVCGIVGARIMFAAVEYKHFMKAPLDIFKVWQGGLVYYGGFIGAVAGGFLFLRARKLNVLQWADLAAPTIVLSLVFGRIGCLLNGCCYGKAAPDLPWGIVYPESHSSLFLGMVRMKVHPAPVYASLANLAIFVLVLMLMRRKKFHGQVLLATMALYAVARFIIEFYRGDRRGFPIDGISTSQCVAVLAIVIALAAWPLIARSRLSVIGAEAGATSLPENAGEKSDADDGQGPEDAGEAADAGNDGGGGGGQ